jgi:hypothetical protein
MASTERRFIMCGHQRRLTDDVGGASRRVELEMSLRVSLIHVLRFVYRPLTDTRKVHIDYAG